METLKQLTAGEVPTPGGMTQNSPEGLEFLITQALEHQKAQYDRVVKAGGGLAWRQKASESGKAIRVLTAECLDREINQDFANAQEHLNRLLDEYGATLPQADTMPRQLKKIVPPLVGRHLL